jgi:hypothetical protein
MNAKRLIGMIVGVMALAVIFSLVTNRTPEVREYQPFAQIDGEKIAKLRVERGEERVELGLRDGVWTVTSRDGYPADAGKVRSLLIKLLDLTVNQKVTDNADNFQALGVAAEGGEKSSTKLTLLDEQSKELGALLLGEGRKGANRDGGQFIRRSDSNDVYLIREALTAAVSAADWLDSELVNVTQTKVRNVRQYRLSTKQETLDFQLVRANPAEFTLKDGGAEELEQTVISQVVAGLENARSEDVLKNENAGEKLKDVTFDAKTEYETSNGLVYTVLSSAEKEGKNYLRLAVRFDAELAKTIEREVAERNAAKQQSSSASEQAGSSSASSEKAELSSAEEAARLEAKFAPWTFVVAQYQNERFRKTRKELFKVKEASSSAAAE